MPERRTAKRSGPLPHQQRLRNARELLHRSQVVAQATVAMPPTAVQGVPAAALGAESMPSIELIPLRTAFLKLAARTRWLHPQTPLTPEKTLLPGLGLGMPSKGQASLPSPAAALSPKKSGRGES